MAVRPFPISVTTPPPPPRLTNNIIIIRVISDYKLKWQSVQNIHTSILFKQWIMESSDIVYKSNQQLP